MKKIIVILIVLLVAGLILKKGWKNDDFKLGIISPDKIALLSVSPNRGMINLLTINPEVEVWLPEGMGWYPSNRIKKIYDNERNMELMKKMFYYNFGFMPEKIAFFSEVDDWRDWNLVKYLGVVEWVRYLVQQENWLYKTETISRNLKLEKEKLDEILPRDFADSQLQSGEVKMTVVNATEGNGLGAFVADRLNWTGFNVVAVESGGSKADCEVMVNTTAKGLIKKYTDLLANMYKCSQINNTTLLPGEIVLYLGEKYASMIKYSSY